MAEIAKLLIADISGPTPTQPKKEAIHKSESVVITSHTGSKNRKCVNRGVNRMCKQEV